MELTQKGEGRAAPPERPGRFLVGTSALYGSDMALSVVLTWSVLALSHSPLLAAIALILNNLPQVLIGILGPGRMGAGHHPSSLLFAAGAGLLAMGGLTAALRASAPLVGVLLLASIVEGLGNAAAIPVAQAWWMGLNAPDRKVRAARDYEIASRLPRILAPVAGSLLLVAGRTGPALAVVGCGFLLTAESWRGSVAGSPASARPFAWSEGLAALGRDRWLATALLLRGISNLLWPAYTIGLPWLVLTRFHQTAFVYGLVATVYGIATLALVFPAGRLSPFRLRRAYMAAWAATGVGVVALALSASVPAVFLAVVLIGLGSPMIHMALDAHIGGQIPLERQASVFAFQRLIMGSAGLFGLYGLGWLLTIFRATTVLTLAGLAIVASAGIASVVARGAPAPSRPG